MLVLRLAINRVAKCSLLQCQHFIINAPSILCNNVTGKYTALLCQFYYAFYFTVNKKYVVKKKIKIVILLTWSFKYPLNQCNVNKPMVIEYN